MLRERIRKEIKKVLPKGMNFSVQRPEKIEFGDYSSNVALVYTQATKENSRGVAEALKFKLEKNKIFKKIEIAGPGFLNFWISEKEVAKAFQKLAKENGLPKFNIGRGKKAQIEFISANPTGPLTLANGRGGFLGDILSNILELAGYKVEREYYVNDTGNQILILGKSMLAVTGLLPAADNFYKADYIVHWAKKNSLTVKKMQKNPLKLGKRAAIDFLREIKSTIKKARIKFDRFTSEDALHQKNFVQKSLGKFRRKKLVYKKDGAVWLKTTSLGDDKDRVLITSDGFPTYFLADAGHYLETKNRGFNHKINILGPDHYGYVARIQATAQILGLKKSEVIVTQAVHLKKGVESIKMSKRKGEFVAFDEFLDEVGVDVSRFFFLMRSADSHIDFDLELAKKKSEENPVYYIQYAHARMSSILRKAKNESYQLPAISYQPDELKFIKKLLEVEDVLEDIAKDYQAHRLTTYLYELAQAFSAFYRDVKVLGSGENEPRRLFIVHTAKNILSSLLTLMGISAPERM